MKKLLRAAAMLGFCAAIGVPATAQNLVQDGSFEEPTVTGSFQTIASGGSIGAWGVTGLGVDLISTYWVAAEGDQSVDLAALGNGGVAQIVYLAQDGDYRLRFAVGANPVLGPNPKVLNVLWDDALYAFNVPINGQRPNITWTYVDILINAGAGDHVLAFVSANDPQPDGTPCGPALDDVSLVAVPEAGSLAMLLPGLLPLAAIARRRARKA